ncbi:MAG: bile acid:sodium symporter family protein [Leptospirales bacterium]|jgi:sodium/bile acid cotransporter 2
MEMELMSSAEKGMLALMILIIMFGMGASLTGENFRYVARNPLGVLIGFSSQFGVMPAVAWFLATYLDFPPAVALSLVLVGCLPAGTTSNLFAYFSRGDVALSISMTTCSTIAAIFMMPILLSFYGAGFASQIDIANPDGTQFAIPIKDIAVSLFLVLLPVALGMTLRKFSEGWAKAAEDTASFFGIIVILFLIVSFLSAEHRRALLWTTGWNVYLGSIMVGIIGFAFGYLVSRVARLAPRYCRTVALETGIQNGPLAFGIVLLAFNDYPQIMNEVLWLPILYSFFIVITSAFTTMFFRKIGRVDHEIYENETVQKRLFGKEWVPVMD